MLLIVLLMASAPLPAKGGGLDWSQADVRAMSFTSDGSAVIAGSATGEVVVWSVGTGEEVRRWKTDKGLTALSLRGDLLACGSENGSVSVWNWQKGRRLARFVTGKQLCSLCLHPNGRSVAVIADNTPILWEVSTGSEIQKLIPTNTADKLCCIAHSPNGKELIVTGESRGGEKGIGAWHSIWNRERLQDAPGGASISRRDADPVWATRRLGHYIAWSPASKVVSYPAVERMSMVEDGVGGGGCKYSCDLVGMAYRANGKNLVIAGGEGVVTILDAKTDKEIATVDKLGPIQHFALSPDGKQFVVANKRKVMLRLLPKEPAP